MRAKDEHFQKAVQVSKETTLNATRTLAVTAGTERKPAHKNGENTEVFLLNASQCQELKLPR